MPIVWIPSLLRELTDGQEKLVVPGATAREVIANLDERYPGIEARLCKDGRLQSNIAVVVDGVISRQGLRQPLAETSEVHFLPSISGG
jgi:molybdopterin converting factor small subunit